MQMGDFHRNPSGRGVFRRMPALLGLDDPFFIENVEKVVVGLSPWPATKTASSRPA